MMRISRGLAGLLLAIGLVILAAGSPLWQGVAEAATLNVNTDQDTNDGVCAATANGCSLRDAIAAAASGDTIEIPANTYTLTHGELSISNKNLTLAGSGATSTIIQAATSTRTANFRVFQISEGNVAISDVTIRHGNIANANGGGILNQGIRANLTLSNSTVSGNTAISLPGGPFPVGNGGGIHNSGTLTMTSSTVSGNAVSGNPARGGGISNEAGGHVTLSNSTVSGNTASRGGGIANYGGTLALNSSTISDNTAGVGGGIINANVEIPDWTFYGTLSLLNTIVAKNAAAGPDCAGSPRSLGHNLIGSTSGCSFKQATGDQVNVDPVLGPLQNNGGPTETHALPSDSPATSAGSCPEGTDQRGVNRPQGGGCEIGAFERQVPVVDRVDDALGAGVCDADENNNNCSLRQAITSASPRDMINVPANTYRLTRNPESTEGHRWTA